MSEDVLRLSFMKATPAGLGSLLPVDTLSGLGGNWRGEERRGEERTADLKSP